MIAALFVERGGAYWDLPGVDPWDEQRDARLYTGPWPVVAHPPCARWSPLAYINRRRIAGYEIGEDKGCFASALNSVQRFGGVLEHPAGSLAWARFGLLKPVRGCWVGGPWHWVTEVDQGRYGHRARKRTWLYAAVQLAPPELDWTPATSDVVVSGFTHQLKGRHIPCEHRRVRPREASRTPEAFRDLLLEIASGVRLYA